MGPRQSPIMGRRALGPPQPSPKVHRRQTSLNPSHHKPEVLHAQQSSPVSNASSSDNNSSILPPPPTASSSSGATVPNNQNLKPVTSIHQVLYQQQQSPTHGQ